ncbi:MAG TPA: hypothetical protein PKE69_17075 [Pyrinomonadaceae bacterium]|nr:hypothetical protein [Pyrinomonadaceae bacterium]
MKILLFLLMTLGFTVVAFSQSNDDKIQGTWRLEGTNGGNVWFLEWTFNRGSFKQAGYPAISQMGKYKIIEERGVQIKLELFDQDGTFGKENRQILVLIDARRNELTIDRKTGFKSKNANTQTAFVYSVFQQNNFIGEYRLEHL